MFCVAVKQVWAIDFNKLNSVLLKSFTTVPVSPVDPWEN